MLKSSMNALTSPQVFEKIRLLDETDLDSFSGHIRNAIRRVTGTRILQLEDYHLTHSEHHGTMGRKSSRELSETSVHEIIGLQGIRSLQQRFSGYSISKVITEHGIKDRPEIYFRLVRPGAGDDVGCPHMDNWFHSIAGLPHRKGSTYKVWISLCSEPRFSGLQFFPDADIQEVEWKCINGKIYCDPKQEALGKAYLPDIKPGEAFIFRDDVLHAGAINRGRKTRVSAEITFVPEAL